MPYQRHIDPHGIVITRLTGIVPLKELIELQNDLTNHACDGEVYELVLHPNDSELLQSPNESLFSAKNVQKILKKIKKGAIAFVANSDFIYGLCRQLQMRVDNDYIQLSVFRTEETALKWLLELKSMNAAQKGSG